MRSVVVRGSENHISEVGVWTRVEGMGLALSWTTRSIALSWLDARLRTGFGYCSPDLPISPTHPLIAQSSFTTTRWHIHQREIYFRLPEADINSCRRFETCNDDSSRLKLQADIAEWLPTQTSLAPCARLKQLPKACPSDSFQNNRCPAANPSTGFHRSSSSSS